MTDDTVTAKWLDDFHEAHEGWRVTKFGTDTKLGYTARVEIEQEGIYFEGSGRNLKEALDDAEDNLNLELEIRKPGTP